MNSTIKKGMTFVRTIENLHRPNLASKQLRHILLSGVVLALTACAAVPEPFSIDETRERVNRDKAVIFGSSAPISGPIALDEALARAIKFNLDHRSEMLSQVVSQRQLNLTSYDLLPKLVTSAGFNSRNNDLASSSESIRTHAQSLEPSTSSERSLVSAQAALTWNILDFGVSYIRAQQSADRTLIADEQKRKVIHNILQDVRTTYWRAVAAERLIGRLDPLLKRTERALADAQALEIKSVRAPLEELQYQRALLNTLEQLRALRRELVGSKTQLAALMNLPPNAEYRVRLPENASQYIVPTLPVSPAEAEEMALYNRPELFQSSYESRISGAETNRILLEMLPGVSFSIGGNYDSNHYTVNSAWASYGVNVVWNLLTLFSTPARLELAEADELMKNVKRAALSMAILAQVEVAYLRYRHAVEEFSTARVQADVESRILRQLSIAGKLKQVDELSVIQAEAEDVFGALRRDTAYANLQNAYGAVMVSIGVDPLPTTLTSDTLPSLTQAVRNLLHSWDDGSALRKALTTIRNAEQHTLSPVTGDASKQHSTNTSTAPTEHPERS
ncbi:hypothetical protein CCP2SC5_1850003 [Azospirillaceae bacterium]